MVEVIGIDKGMKMSEDLIDGTVLTSAIPPTLDHSLVVPIDDEVPTRGPRVDEVVDRTLKNQQPQPSQYCAGQGGFSILG